MWTILKVFTEFLTVLLLFYVLVFWSGSQFPDQGWNPHDSTRRQSLNHWTARASPLTFLMTEYRFKCSPFAFFDNLGVHFFRVFSVHPRQWWIGRPGVLRFMGSQRVGHD